MYNMEERFNKRIRELANLLQEEKNKVQRLEEWKYLTCCHAPHEAAIATLNQVNGDLEIELQVAEKTIKGLQDKLEHLEGLRPIWAKGFDSASIAAQATSNAINQLWGLLGVNNQTEAVQKIKFLKEQVEIDNLQVTSLLSEREYLNKYLAEAEKKINTLVDGWKEEIKNKNIHQALEESAESKLVDAEKRADGWEAMYNSELEMRENRDVKINNLEFHMREMELREVLLKDRLKLAAYQLAGYGDDEAFKNILEILANFSTHTPEYSDLIKAAKAHRIKVKKWGITHSYKCQCDLCQTTDKINGGD